MQIWSSGFGLRSLRWWSVVYGLVFGFMIHDYCLWLGNDGLWCVVYGLWFLLNDYVLMIQCSWARNRVEGLPGGG